MRPSISGVVTDTLVWGSTWMVVSDGFTSGSDHPDVVRRLAQDLELPQHGLALSGRTPDALYDLQEQKEVRKWPSREQNSGSVRTGTPRSSIVQVACPHQVTSAISTPARPGSSWPSLATLVACRYLLDSAQYGVGMERRGTRGSV